MSIESASASATAVRVLSSTHAQESTQSSASSESPPKSDALTQLRDYLTQSNDPHSLRRQPSNLTRAYTSDRPRHITFSCIWESRCRAGLPRLLMLPYLCLNQSDLQRDLEHMVGVDHLVTGPCERAVVLVHFPFPKRQQHKIQPAEPTLGFRRGELCGLLSQVYECAFATAWMDARAAGQQSTYAVADFLVDGYRMRDLLLRSVLWDPGLQEFSCALES